MDINSNSTQIYSESWSLKTNGYVNFGSGFCIQWGSFSSANSNDIVFPTAFTTAYRVVTQTHSNEPNTLAPSRYGYGLTNTGFSHSKAGSVTATMYYIAVGKKS